MSRNCCTGSAFTIKKQIERWQDFMRKYSEKHKETCKFSEIPPSRLKDFPTGSSYDGEFDTIGMSGYGEYTFPNGVVYRGQFEDGMFHGHGELVYNDGPEANSVIRGVWVKGVLTHRKVLFNGNLEYDEHDWKYCKLPDRRYDVEYEMDLLLAGKSHLTPDNPPREIPPGFYDTGNGFYNPKTKAVYDYERQLDVIRGPSLREQKWLVDNCRKEPMGTVGPRPDCYETWTAPVPEPAPLPKPIVGYKKITKNPYLFEQDYEDGAYGPAFYDPSSHIDLQSTKYPCTCQWLCLMREFRQKHEEKCKSVELPGPTCKSHDFLTGSSYDGGWQEGCGMHGYGVYTFTNGVIYEGEFFEGAFHGKGELRYQTPAGKAVIRGQWYKGLMMKRTLLFDGVLEHDPKDWQYCKMPDRRFTREYADGVQLGGKSFMTAYEPYVDVPEGYYDTGDGFFDITRKMVYEHDDYTKILRGPALAEQRWIQENCRMGKKDMTIGPRQDLYEKYLEPTALLEPVPPPPAKFMPITRKESTFEQYEDLDDAPVFYDASKFGTDAGPPERKFKH